LFLVLEAQREDLLLSIPSDKILSGDCRIKFYVNNEVLSEIDICGTFNVFIKCLSPERVGNRTVKVLIGGRYIEISRESLLKGILNVTDNPNLNLSFMNYMSFKVFELNNNPIPNDKALLISLDAVMKPSGLAEKNRLKSCIDMVHHIKTNAKGYFYAPFLNVCQSSGSGKTKIATDLMLEIPSFYVVFREEIQDQDSLKMVQCGYPYMSQISELFLDFRLNLNNEPSSLDACASQSIVGRYLLILKAIFSDYVDSLNNRNLLTIFKEIMAGTFIGKDLELYKEGKWGTLHLNKNTLKFQDTEDSESILITIKNVIGACQKLLKCISNHPHPFVLIVDEASTLCTKFGKNRVSLFRLFRRAVNMLERKCNLVVLTLGTNSDVLDLNPDPDLSLDSFRESTIGRTFPPFLLSRNWDVFIDYEELQKSPIGYNQILNGRMMIFWASLGRPLWSSISFYRLMDFVRIKICNKSLETGEAFLAFWMVRVGLLVNPSHVVTQHLVKSLMGTLLYVSSNLRSMRVYYPSEPILAVEIRSMLLNEDNFRKYYAALEKFIKHRAIDTARFSEIISADICLLAMAKSKASSCTWKYDESLPKVCAASSFVFETGEFRSKDNQQEIQEEKARVEKDNTYKKQIDEDISNYFSSKYIITEGIEFVRSLYGLEGKENENISSLIDRFVPELMKSALINMSHYTQMSTAFPFEVYVKGFNDDLKMTVPPLANPQYAKNGDICNQITAEILETMIMRGSGIILAPNTYGLDHVIPVCLKPAEDPTSTTKPEYSFIGVQVKRGSGSNIRKIVSKGAISNHFVRCGLKGNDGCNCESNTCKFRLSDDYYKRILENGLMLIHSMTDDEIYFKGSNNYDDDDDDDNYDDDDDQMLTRGLKQMKFDMDSYKFTCETSLPGSRNIFERLRQLKREFKDKRILKEQYDSEKKAIENNLRVLVKDLCPVEFNDKLDQFEFKEFKASHYEGCRFIPDIHIEVRASKELTVHCMVRRRVDQINEKIVAIHTKGLNSFSSKVLPEKSKEIARRIIFYDRSIFDEIDYDPKADENKKPPIKYTELITGVVSRNNNSAIPIANNYIRHKYGLPPIPDHLPDYENVEHDNIEDIL
jgi:hypothetical protein